MSIKQVFAHLHIPKCGGSTVSHFLQRNFGLGYGDVNGILNDYQYDEDQIYAILSMYPNLRCLSGHKLSIDLPFNRQDLDVHAFTWIRDPIDRFISHYYYHRADKKMKTLYSQIIPQTLTMDLMEYSEWALKEGNQPMYINGQLKFLGGSLSRVESLVKDGKLSLFPLESLEESIFLLARKFPTVFVDTKIVNKNTRKNDKPLHQELRNFILPYVQEDLQLLELSKKIIVEERKQSSHLKPMKLSGSDKLKIFRRRLTLSTCLLLSNASRYISRHGLQ